MMTLNEWITAVCGHFSAFANSYLMPTMLLAWFGAIMARMLIYYTIKAEERFSVEFEKRVHKFLDGDFPELKGKDFHFVAEDLLNKTVHEAYRLRAKYMRRKLDWTGTVADRLFLIEQGSQRVVADTLKQTRYYGSDLAPDFSQVSKYVYANNPFFNKLMGIFPVGGLNDVLAIMPGLFIVGGIFGTFIGIVTGLPMLKGMDVTNIEAARKTLDVFLVQMAFSMNTSIVGIAFAVVVTVLNTMLSPVAIYLGLVDRYKSSLEFVWNDTLPFTGMRSIPSVANGGASGDADEGGGPGAAPSMPEAARAPEETPMPEEMPAARVQRLAAVPAPSPAPAPAALGGEPPPEPLAPPEADVVAPGVPQEAPQEEERTDWIERPGAEAGEPASTEEPVAPPTALSHDEELAQAMAEAEAEVRAEAEKKGDQAA